ncbi:thymidine kinase [Pseudooceanicola batsensis HTCC2597]|uniref:Thymidine kinase n=1 Tax=Pseudooceanicola batsensis (strain ATCC BAA-863 / DSM 15984 / KCTC 12145 / HTCC2597) TaxID=252305 RepID=A3TTQ6_PSEBH|nr:VPLPA-CTERM sorting domain-containing protein [Pseudooceanicola batsensis]EAQ05033.1 thymidine kinase [Pseudooceanicola batsensis HTCC2597]
MKLFALCCAAILSCAAAAQATTIRYTYDTEASRSGTQIFSFPFVSGPTNTYAGLYHGVTAHVSGTIDIDNSGASDVVTAFDLETRLPHGLPQGYIDLAGVNNFEVQASLDLAFGDGTAVTVLPNMIHLRKDFGFDTRFGDPYLLFGSSYPSPSYDRTDATLYPFSMNLSLQKQADGSYNVSSLRMTCEERDHRGNVNSSSCNGFYTGNSGTWDSTAGAAASAAIVPATTDPITPAVPLPAGGVLLISGLTALALRKRKS